MNRWWLDDPAEHYWLEVTDRDDLGVDLNAPEKDETGRARWSYELMKEPTDGDVVFHYWKPEQAIVARSIVRGPWWNDEVVWGAHGTSARDRNVLPYPRPGYRRGLQHTIRLPKPIRLVDVIALRDQVLQLARELEHQHGVPIYFPFVRYREGIRPAQGYMVKMPVGLLSLLGLERAERRPEQSAIRTPRARPHPSSRPPVPQVGGTTYRPANELLAVSKSRPMERDPALVERGLRSHRSLQNAIATELVTAGVRPLSPMPDDPDWDVAWRREDVLYVCEIKSVTEANEELQLRLGLGQVLRYRDLIGRRERAVAVLAIERAPRDERWTELCQSLGITLIWPPDLREKILGAGRPDRAVQ